MKKISIIIPTFNEEENINLIYKRISSVFSKLPFRKEIIFVDNDSTDKTLKKVKEIQKKDISVILITLSRNFGSSQPSYLAGIQQCNGDAAILIDGDLQDPPEVIPDLIKKWQEGFDVVYGERIKRRGSLPRVVGYKLFYRLFKAFSYINIPLDAGDFSLIDRKVLNEMKKFDERDYYVRGIRSFVGFSQIGVPYIREERKFGRSSLSFFDNFFWAKKAIINFSNKPLEFISITSLVISILSFFAILFYFYLYIFTVNKPRGIPTIIALVLFLGSIQLLAISIIAEYIANIFTEVKRRPTYIVKKIYKA